MDPTSRNKRGRHKVGGHAYHPRARPPPSWAPCCSTDVLLPPIYTYVPPNDQIRSQNPNSTAATFCIHEIQETWTLLQEASEEVTRVEGAPPGCACLPRGPLGAPPTYSFLLYIPTYPQTNRDGAKNLIPPPQLSVSTRSHLGACFGAPPEGASITEGFYIIIQGPSMKCE